MKIDIFGSNGLINKLFGRNSEETADELFDKANQFFEKGNTGDAYVYLQAAAVKGHAEAAFQMGSAIAEQKTFGSMEDAVKYLSIASDHDHPFATTNLATCYQMGNGVKVDHVKALHLLNKAIKLGDEMAEFNLAQTYLCGVGVKQDEEKGWSMLERLAANGNNNARAYMNDLLQKGYEAPIKRHVEQGIPEELHEERTDSYLVDHAPEGVINDAKIFCLYESAKLGDKSAIDELMELGGNQMNRDTMNALRKLGLIKEDVSDAFKRETVEYIAEAWKTYNVEPLYIVCAWTYPGFVYREYENGKILFKTSSEDVFIERIANELSRCTNERIAPKFRLREVKNTSGYCVDVLIQGVSISSFYLDIEKNHFKGIYRVFDNSII